MATGHRGIYDDTLLSYEEIVELNIVIVINDFNAGLLMFVISDTTLIEVLMQKSMRRNEVCIYTNKYIYVLSLFKSRYLEMCGCTYTQRCVCIY
jgi:hypothetical protein